MARTNRSSNSRRIRNLRPVAKGIGNAAEKTAKWMATDHTGSVDYSLHQSNLMESQQSINFILARMALGNRHVRRLIDRHQRLVDTGEETGFLEIAIDWIVDRILFIWDLLWGFIEPLVSFILFGLFRIVLIVVVNIVFFGVIYLLLTAH